MSSCDTSIALNRGSDIYHEFICKDDAGDPINMTGWTIALFEAETWLAANGVIAWTDQAAGEARLTAAWSSSTPAKTWFIARLTRTSDGFDDALPKVTVRFS
jgi:hypothetical protein